MSIEGDLAEASAGGGVALSVRLREAEDSPTRLIAARVAGPDVLREPGDRWIL